ncbi:hypothetical protein STENM223S_05988 [Streptomyces tendae]
MVRRTRPDDLLPEREGVRRSNQAAIQNGTTKGYAAYRVDDSVDTHEAWGLGSYCDYNVDPNIGQDHGLQDPVKPA